MTTMMITWPNISRPHAWVGVACFWWGNLGTFVRRHRGRRSFWLPVLIRLGSSVIHGHPANATTPSGRRGDAAATDALTLTSGGRARTPAEVRPAPSEAPPLSRGSTAPAKREWDRRARAACSCAGSQVWGSFAPAASSSRSRTAYLWLSWLSRDHGRDLVINFRASTTM